MRGFALALALGLAVPAAHADPAADVLGGPCWPREVPLQLALPAADAGRKLPDLTRSVWKDAELQVPGGLPASRTSSLPGAAESKPAPAASAAPGAIAQLERAERGLQSQIVELSGASGDYLLVMTGGKDRRLLRPLLLYLVERGVLGAGEVDALLAATEPQPLMLRLKSRLDGWKNEREALLVRRWLAIPEEGGAR